MRLAEHFFRFFRNEFNKFNHTGARMLDSLYHMTPRLLWNLISGVNKSLCTQYCNGRHFIQTTLPEKSVNQKWCIDFNAWRYITSRRNGII